MAQNQFAGIDRTTSVVCTFRFCPNDFYLFVLRDKAAPRQQTPAANGNDDNIEALNLLD